MKHIKPNFFLIGAAKSGTTTLANMLSLHSHVYISPIKEPNYFSTDIDINSFSTDYKKNTFFADESYFRHKPLRLQHLSFIRNEHHYYQLFEDVKNEIAIGECSTSYLFSTTAAAEIKKFNPDAKIMAILRNPVSRAFSHYLMALKYGYTSLPFREEILNDFNRSLKGWGISRLYIELGLYGQQLYRYYQHFEKNRILIILYDKFLSDPIETFSEIFDFLDIPFRYTELSERYNEAVIPRFQLLNKWVTQTGLRPILRNLFPSKVSEKLKRLFYSKEKLPQLTENDKKYFLDFFREDIKLTSELTGYDLSHWLD